MLHPGFVAPPWPRRVGRAAVVVAGLAAAIAGVQTLADTWFVDRLELPVTTVTTTTSRPIASPPPPPVGVGASIGCAAAPWDWSVFRGLTNNAAIVVVGQIRSIDAPGNEAVLALEQIVVGDRRHRFGSVIRIHYPQDTQIGDEIEVGKRYLAFLSGRRSGHVPVFHQHDGMWELDRDTLVDLIDDQLLGDQQLGDVIRRVREFARDRGGWAVKVSSRARLSEGTVRLRVWLRNHGTRTLRAFSPSARCVWLGVEQTGFGDCVAIGRPGADLVKVPPEDSVRFVYDVPLARLGIDRPGTYSLYVAIYSDLPDGYSPDDAIAHEVWMGGMEEQTLTFTVAP